ncbi:MAG: cysteine desulfurase [Polaribacter sp.]|jgi:cysteine desulfurase
MRVYLDNAATTAINKEVVEIMTQVMLSSYGNPSSIHMEGRTARSTIETARKKVAELIGASMGEIFFTSGGTESNNMILNCAVRDMGVTRIISSKAEHHCILHTLESLEDCQKIEVVFIAIDAKGRPDLNQLNELLADQRKKTLVTLMHSNNEIGTMVNLEQVSAICEKHNTLFHSDTVQTLGHFPIDVSKTKIHFLTGSAHKFHGPKGVGFSYINGDCTIKPFINGGSQERNMRAGTENIYGIAGLAAALDISCKSMTEKEAHIRGVRQHLINELRENFDDIQFNGDYEGRYHYKVLSVSFPPSPKSELMLLNLDIKGISASGGSACSSGAEAGSHVLQAIGADPSRKSVRFSFSVDNTKEEINYVIKQLKTIIPVKATVNLT